MGMSTHVMGFRPPDDRWQAMKDVWEACEQAGIKMPTEVTTFFGGTNRGRPDDSGVEVDLGPEQGVTEYRGDMEEGYEIDVRKLPTDLHIIRVYNSW